MEFPPFTAASYVVVFSILLLSLSYYISSKRRAAATRLPPSPPGLPIIGNLHQLSSLSHRSLRALSDQHGPLMLLRLGQVPTLVVSSAAAAEELIKAHDVAVGGRPKPAASRALERDGRSITFSPYGDYWRQAKKACIVHLLNHRRVREFRPAREEEVARLLAAVAGESSSSSGGSVDLTRALSCFANAVVCRALFGREQAADRRTLDRITELIGMQATLLGGFQVDDFFPSVGWVSLFTGKRLKLKEIVGYWYGFLDGVVDAHVRRRRVVEESSTEEDFVDSLLSLRGGGGGGADGDFAPSMADIKVILMDLISAGTDTSHGTLVWAMTELVRSPADMKRLQEEVRGIAEEGKKKPMVTEDDVDRMPFLKATVKETLRLHPPAPLLIPRVAMKPVRLRGYDAAVPANTQVIINAWAIGRDPASWECPEEFRPERFLGSSVDFRGNDFQFIPFGAGRRICPGMQFAATTVELALANLVYRFDWGLPEGMDGGVLDVEEAPGLTVKTKASLRLVAKSRSTTCQPS